MTFIGRWLAKRQSERDAAVLLAICLAGQASGLEIWRSVGFQPYASLLRLERSGEIDWLWESLGADEERPRRKLYRLHNV